MVWQKAIDRRYYGNGFEDVEDVARAQVQNDFWKRAFLHAREMTVFDCRRKNVQFYVVLHTPDIPLHAFPFCLAC